MPNTRLDSFLQYIGWRWDFITFLSYTELTSFENRPLKVSGSDLFVEYRRFYLWTTHILWLLVLEELWRSLRHLKFSWSEISADLWISKLLNLLSDVLWSLRMTFWVFSRNLLCSAEAVHQKYLLRRIYKDHQGMLGGNDYEASTPVQDYGSSWRIGWALYNLLHESNGSAYACSAEFPRLSAWNHRRNRHFSHYN